MGTARSGADMSPLRASGKSIAITLAIVVAIVAVTMWWLATHERVWYDRPLPLEGEATYNDFYAVQQALRAQGVRTEAIPALRGIETWGARDSLLLGSDTRTLAPPQIDALLDWVGRGGRLLVATGARAPSANDELLERIGVRSGFANPCYPLRGAGKGAPLSCFTGFSIREGLRDNFQVALGDEKNGWILARSDWGRGQIEVVGDLDPLRLNNEQILPIAVHAFQRPRDADWAWQILSPLLQGGVLHVVYQSELPPLYALLLRYGWFALLPALLALLGWLWAASQRFGPAAPMPAPDRRALGEHIAASGQYLYREGQVGTLYAPLRRRFDEWLRRRDPELAALPHPEQIRQLAQRHQLSPQAVEQALHSPLPRQPRAFVAAVQTLLQLIRRP